MTDTKRSAAAQEPDSPTTTVQKVVVVDGGIEMLHGLETMLHARRYQMLFAQSNDLAYSQIKKVRPNLVVLCGGIENPDGSQLLTMLKLDPDTRGIPLMSYAPGRKEGDVEADLFRLDEEEDLLTPAHPALRMN
jgi:PleD family two-component response regulator